MKAVRKLKSMPYAQCRVRFYADTEYARITLQSYTTDVIIIELNHIKESVSWRCTGTYSQTTARHINRFTTEFFGKNLYYACKEAPGTTVIERDEQLYWRLMRYAYNEYGINLQFPEVNA